MNWADTITDDRERKVLAALADPQWDFRTVQGIARETGLPEPEVSVILNKYPDLIRRAYVPDPSGRDLFTLKERPAKLREKLALLRTLVAGSIH